MKFILKKEYGFTPSLSRSEGFTLIEILISMAIFIIILTLVMVSYRQGENSNIFRLQAFDIEDSIRSVQNMALTGKEIEDIIPDAYGIFFSGTGDDIVMYGDRDGDNLFNRLNDVVYSEHSLDKRVSFSDYTLSCGATLHSTSLNIVFAPPQPIMIINNFSICTSSIIFLDSNGANGEWRVHFDAITGRTWTEFSE